jgi:hypothetical protein
VRNDEGRKLQHMTEKKGRKGGQKTCNKLGKKTQLVKKTTKM